MVDKLSMDDESLGRFVEIYCDVNRIHCDWKLFLIIFRGMDKYSVIHAVELIEQFADLCCLRKA